MSIVNVVGFHSKKMKKIDPDVDARSDVKCFQRNCLTVIALQICSTSLVGEGKLIFDVVTLKTHHLISSLLCVFQNHRHDS